MDCSLEVVVVPVADVGRSLTFYVDGLGFVLDHDMALPGGVRFAQLTPPGSGCSIVVSQGMVDMAPGSQRGLQLVVPDVLGAREELLGRGVEVSQVVVFSPQGPRPYEVGDALQNVGFVHLSDPDGNAWSIQQIDRRATRGPLT